MDGCGCGGVYVPVSDSLTVETGGHTQSHVWWEDHCDRCGCQPLETCEKCKVKEVAESA